MRKLRVQHNMVSKLITIDPKIIEIEGFQVGDQLIYRYLDENTTFLGKFPKDLIVTTHDAQTQEAVYGSFETSCYMAKCRRIIGFYQHANTGNYDVVVELTGIPASFEDEFCNYYLVAIEKIEQLFTIDIEARKKEKEKERPPESVDMSDIHAKLRKAANNVSKLRALEKSYSSGPSGELDWQMRVRRIKLKEIEQQRLAAEIRQAAEEEKLSRKESFTLLDGSSVYSTKQKRMGRHSIGDVFIPVDDELKEFPKATLVGFSFEKRMILSLDDQGYIMVGTIQQNFLPKAEYEKKVAKEAARQEILQKTQNTQQVGDLEALKALRKEVASEKTEQWTFEAEIQDMKIEIIDEKIREILCMKFKLKDGSEITSIGEYELGSYKVGDKFVPVNERHKEIKEAVLVGIGTFYFYTGQSHIRGLSDSKPTYILRLSNDEYIEIKAFPNINSIDQEFQKVD